MHCYTSQCKRPLGLNDKNTTRSISTWCLPIEATYKIAYYVPFECVQSNFTLLRSVDVLNLKILETVITHKIPIANTTTSSTCCVNQYSRASCARNACNDDLTRMWLTAADVEARNWKRSRYCALTTPGYTDACAIYEGTIELSSCKSADGKFCGRNQCKGKKVDWRGDSVEKPLLNFNVGIFYSVI